MMKNILKLSKIKILSKPEQKSIFGGRVASRCIADCGEFQIECENLICSATDGVSCTTTDINGNSHTTYCAIAIIP